MYDTPIEETGHTGLTHDGIGSEPCPLPVNVAFVLAGRGWDGDR